MGISLHISIDYTRPPEVAARMWSDFCKDANMDVADEWHQKYLPSHFAEFGQQRYRLQHRAPSTLKKKAALARGGLVKHGGRRALVHTGLLREQVTRRGILKVYPTRFTLSMPSHVPRRPRFSSILLHDEITRTIPSEDRALGKIWKAKILQRLENYKPRRRVKL